MFARPCPRQAGLGLTQAPARLQRPALTQRRAMSRSAQAKEGGGVGSYLAEAASQIFSPTKNDTPWTSSDFSGRIAHHDEVARLRHLYSEIRQVRFQIEGCMDPNAPNFNPDATADDGSCVVVLSDGESTAEGTVSLREFVVTSLKKLWGNNFESTAEAKDPFKGTTYAWTGDKPISQRDIQRLLNYEKTVKRTLEQAEESAGGS